MGGNLKVWVLKFRGKIFGGNIMVYISSGETNTVYRFDILRRVEPILEFTSLVSVSLSGDLELKSLKFMPKILFLNLF